jgi:hypothetical protein
VNADEQTGAVGQDDWFVRAAGVVGDLGNPFYREERERDVWNEASAVGLQLVLWLGLAAAAGMVWLGGSSALPYATVVFAILGASSGVGVLYAHRLGVRVSATGRVLRLRLVPYLALVVLFMVGALRDAPSSGVGASFVLGMAVGGAAGVLMLVWSGIHARRKARLDDNS